MITQKIREYMSLRDPQLEALNVLNSISSKMDYKNCTKKEAEIIASENCEIQENIKIDEEFDFPSFCFAMATGLGKTRLLGASIYYLYKTKGYKHFFILAPGNTIYEKLIKESNSSHPKYLFKGLENFEEPEVFTGENYTKYSQIKFNDLDNEKVQIFIFNIGKIFTRGDKEFKFHSYEELLGGSFSDILRNFDDLVVLMDEAHRYYAPASKTAINYLNPILGLEFTATPKSSNKNIIYSYDLEKACGKYLKIPVVIGRTNTTGYQQSDIEEMKIKDGIKLHEERKKYIVEYCNEKNIPLKKPIVLIACKNTDHAKEIRKMIDSDSFFKGKYRGKVMEVHSKVTGEESEENIHKLLTIEESTNPIEIVLHVYQLKEGWDVNNLFTIIPLNAAKSEILALQTIGRGLRLPFGELTGIEELDTLEIVAHEHYREIIEDVKDNPLFKKRDLDENEPEETKQIRIESFFGDKTKEMQLSIKTNDIKKSSDLLKPENANKLYDDFLKSFTPKEKKEQYSTQTDTLFDLINENSDKKNENTDYIENNDNKETIIAQETADNKIMSKEEYIEKLTEYANRNIDVPKIRIHFNTNISFKPFNTVKNIQDFEKEKALLQRYDLLNNKLLEAVEATKLIAEDAQNVLACMLLDSISEFSYEDADYILVLVNQYISLINEDEETTNEIVRRYGALIIQDMKKQIYENIVDETEITYKVEDNFIIFSGFNKNIKKENGELNYKKVLDKKSEIKKYAFKGFKKSFYDKVAFDSNTEKEFAQILEEDKEVLKWIKPPLNQLGIFYKSGSQYNPDFIVETNDKKYIVEIKDHSELKDDVVLLKAKVAIKWCEYANKTETDKKWEYKLLADDKVVLGSSFKYTVGLSENLRGIWNEGRTSKI